MSETREQIIERMARALKPYLWGDFAAKLATLSRFTPEMAEESAAKKRSETMVDAEVMLPVAIKAVTDRVREGLRDVAFQGLVTTDDLLALLDQIDAELGGE